MKIKGAIGDGQWAIGKRHEGRRTGRAEHGHAVVEIWPDIGHNRVMAYTIVFAQNAIEDFKALDARFRALVRDSVRIHLSHEPTKESRSHIKRLRDLRHPRFRLRVESLRVFYDVTETEVVILAIMSKEKTLEWLKEHGNHD